MHEDLWRYSLDRHCSSWLLVGSAASPVTLQRLSPHSRTDSPSTAPLLEAQQAETIEAHSVGQPDSAEQGWTAAGDWVDCTSESNPRIWKQVHEHAQAEWSWIDWMRFTFLRHIPAILLAIASCKVVLRETLVSHNLIMLSIPRQILSLR